MSEENGTVADVAVEETGMAEKSKSNGVKAWTPQPSLTHKSLAAYVTKHAGIEITPEQAHAILAFHGKWQKDPARIAEREQEAQGRSALAEQRKQEAAAKRAEQAERRAAEQAEAAERKATKKPRKSKVTNPDAAIDDSDLDELDDEVDDVVEDSDAAPAAPRRRRKAGAASAATF